jgi:hypothetical protein
LDIYPGLRSEIDYRICALFRPRINGTSEIAKPSTFSSLSSDSQLAELFFLPSKQRIDLQQQHRGRAASEFRAQL